MLNEISTDLVFTLELRHEMVDKPVVKILAT